MDVGTAGPSEHEEADGREDGGVQGGDEEALGFGEAAHHDFFFKDEFEVAEINGDRDANADENDEEDKAHFAERHAVAFDVDDGEDFEEGVVDSVDDHNVDGCEEDCWVEKVDLPWSDHGFVGDGGESEFGLVDFGL